MQRSNNGSDVTGFGRYDNSTFKRVVDLLGARWSETWAGCDKESCNSQAWSEKWKWRWWKLFWYLGMDGYSKADEYGNSKFWRQMRSGRKKWGVHQIWSRGFEQSGWCWLGVVDFGKLFTETNEQKFSLGGVKCKKICSHPGRNLI